MIPPLECTRRRAGPPGCVSIHIASYQYGWMPATGHPRRFPAPGSVGSLQGTVAERRRDLLETAEHVLVEPDHLGDDDVGIFAVLRQALHHGTEKGLREPGRAIQRLFNGEPSGSLGALHLRPDFLEQHAGTPGARRFRGIRQRRMTGRPTMDPRSEERCPATGAANPRGPLRLPGAQGPMRAANAPSIALAHHP